MCLSLKIVWILHSAHFPRPQVFFLAIGWCDPKPPGALSMGDLRTWAHVLLSMAALSLLHVLQVWGCWSEGKGKGQTSLPFPVPGTSPAGEAGPHLSLCVHGKREDKCSQSVNMGEVHRVHACRHGNRQRRPDRIDTLIPGQEACPGNLLAESCESAFFAFVFVKEVN